MFFGFGFIFNLVRRGIFLVTRIGGNKYVVLFGLISYLRKLGGVLEKVFLFLRENNRKVSLWMLFCWGVRFG